eukprot:CAMPEP_0184749878 /NCGR_PEP_ID=MMETSP0315-20130426/31754_1 /TAXON_ID=101924 /ORGANISM="Rhodosorus marinus, Strain UTEX LB 2760" /LENGTH=39 /DNA_ID= /DNA_START= /DNA_END= /DNA_ORIENTATION=
MSASVLGAETAGGQMVGWMKHRWGRTEHGLAFTPQRMAS